MKAKAPLLEIEDLHTVFYTDAGFVRAVNGVEFALAPKQILGLVGESGCGKTVTGLSILGLIPQPPGRIEQGHIVFEGTDLLTLSDKDMRRIRGNRIAMIFQEPTTALDVTIQAQILELIHRLRVDTGTAILLITHDLGVIAEMADNVAVMYLGKIVELGSCRELFLQPLNPYTEALIAAVPITDRKKRGRRIILDGDVPSPLNPPRGCRFHPRCRYRQSRCTGQEPPLREVNTDRWAACYYPL